MSESHLIAKRSDYKTSHLLHLVLSMVTIGIWLPVWALVTISNLNEIRKIDKKLERLHGV